MATRWMAALAFVSTVAWGQSPSMHEYCTANSTEKLMADATALVIGAGAVSANGAGTFRVDNVPNTTDFSPGDPYCPEVPFFGQDRATSGRTAFLVGSNLMVTAAHTAIYNPVGSKVVFGLNAA